MVAKWIWMMITMDGLWWGEHVQRQMEPRAMLFPKGAMNLIICKANEYALTIEQPHNPKNSRIIGCKAEPEDSSQLWFIDQINNADCEFVNALCSYCFDEEKGEIRLKKGKQKDDQLFSIERVAFEGFYDYYWIKTEKHGKKAVCLQGVLKYVSFDDKDENQMFRFEAIVSNQELDNTALMLNVASGKVLDVPEASRKEGVAVAQYSKNRRFNQRWIFERGDGGIVIRNLNSKLVLDVEGESKKPGTRVIQWRDTGKSNQAWRFEQRGNNTFVIRSVLQPKLCFSLQHNGVNDLDKVVISKTQTIWHIQGRLPFEK